MLALEVFGHFCDDKFELVHTLDQVFQILDCEDSTILFFSSAVKNSDCEFERSIQFSKTCLYLTDDLEGKNSQTRELLKPDDAENSQ